MQVVTILGAINGKDRDNPNIIKKSKYKFDDKLSKIYNPERGEYINMFPLLVDNFDEVIPIFTDRARKIQKEVLDLEFSGSKSCKFDDKNLINDDKNFYEILKIINNATSSDGEYIVDLTHGFRHIPILATISLITQNLSDTSNIKHIFFAKDTGEKDNYEIIDLKEYLELANLSYMLETFDKNYTVSAISKFENDNFEELRKELNTISNHILSNSLKALKTSFKKVLFNIENIEKNEHIATFENSIKNIKEHISNLKEINQKDDYLMLYEMAKLMKDKGYLLNSITMFFEAIGFYCADRFMDFDPLVKRHINEFKSRIGSASKKSISVYELAHQSRTFVKILIDEKNEMKSYLFGKDDLDMSEKQAKDHLNNIIKIISNCIRSIDGINNFQNFIIRAEGLRNNLTHGNSSKEIENARATLSQLLGEFNKICIKDDILRIKR